MFSLESPGNCTIPIKVCKGDPSSRILTPSQLLIPGSNKTRSRLILLIVALNCDQLSSWQAPRTLPSSLLYSMIDTAKIETEAQSSQSQDYCCFKTDYCCIDRQMYPSLLKIISLTIETKTPRIKSPRPQCIL